MIRSWRPPGNLGEFHTATASPAPLWIALPSGPTPIINMRAARRASMTCGNASIVSNFSGGAPT